MKLTVLSVAYPFAPVGPDAVGGAEQVLSHLDFALARAGHHSIVVASEGSQTAGTLIAMTRLRCTIDDIVRQRMHGEYRQAIEEVLRSCPVDLVHMHGLDFFAYLPPADVPVLATLHVPRSWYHADLFALGHPGLLMHCVSGTQRSSYPTGASLLPEIPNGVAPEFFGARHAKRGFALALGRICPEKGFHIALDGARRAGVALLLAGKTFPYEAHQRYFENEIVPRLDEKRRFIGPVGMARKRRLLAAAQCVLIPSTESETSSLVAMEALACGTPVIAFPSGALSEIVEHGKTGFLVSNEREMAEAIRTVGAIDPQTCRETAQARFTLQRMIDRYFEVYRFIARSQPGQLIKTATVSPDSTRVQKTFARTV